MKFICKCNTYNRKKLLRYVRERMVLFDLRLVLDEKINKRMTWSSLMN